MHKIALEKHPDDDLLYEVDFRLRDDGLNGEALASADWSCDDNSLTIVVMAVSGQRTQARMSGGTAGTTYSVTVEGTSTPGGYVAVQELALTVKTAA